MTIIGLRTNRPQWLDALERAAGMANNFSGGAAGGQEVKPERQESEK